MKFNLINLGKALVSRDMAKSTFSNLQINDDELLIDFGEVESVSPSFCHEMLTNILSKNPNLKKVDFLNTSQDIKAQLQKALSSIKEDNK